MKKILLAAALATSLAGCVGTPGNPPLPSPTQIDNAVAQIQAYTQQFCRFVPTIGTVTRIIDAFAGTGAAGYVDIANQICAAVTAAPSARKLGARPTVRGVVIKGQFVR